MAAARDYEATNGIPVRPDELSDGCCENVHTKQAVKTPLESIGRN